MIHSLRPLAGAAGAANLPAHELVVQPFIQRVLDLPGLLKISRHPIFSHQRCTVPPSLQATAKASAITSILL